MNPPMNTKKESTAVSGILPIHNGEHWIKKNLENILSTLRQQDELVIVENGSSDRSHKLLTDYKKQDSRINLISLSRPGLVDSLNAAVNESTNELLARFDIDDSYSSFRLACQVQTLMDSDQNCGAVFSDYRITSESGFHLGRIYSPIFPFQTKLSLFNSQRTAHPSVLFRKSLVLEAGMYRKDDFPAEDLGP